MARYEAPPNPKRPRRQRGGKFDWTPLIGLLLGLIVTVVAVYLAWQFAQNLLAAPPIDVALPTPTVIQLTAPPSITPTPTAVGLASPTPIFTLTPQPTVDVSSAPEVVTAGYYAAVANTDGAGLSLRGGPSTDNVSLILVAEESVVLILEGPSESSGYSWWKVQLDDGTEGWMAAQYLV
ncbi:MAG TPA: SH3 domain-containing protein, partial [Anaerolineae bacterium]|nr:SH3 domain-containing protein [Anaerolineae bacterium]